MSTSPPGSPPEQAEIEVIGAHRSVSLARDRL